MMEELRSVNPNELEIKAEAMPVIAVIINAAPTMLDLFKQTAYDEYCAGCECHTANRQPYQYVDR